MKIETIPRQVIDEAGHHDSLEEFTHLVDQTCRPMEAPLLFLPCGRGPVWLFSMLREDTLLNAGRKQSA